MSFKHIQTIAHTGVCLFKNLNPYFPWMPLDDGSHWIPCRRRRVPGFVAGSLGLLQLRRLVLGGLRQGRAELPAGGPGDGLRLGSGGWEPMGTSNHPKLDPF